MDLSVEEQLELIHEGDLFWLRERAEAPGVEELSLHWSVVMALIHRGDEKNKPKKTCPTCSGAGFRCVAMGRWGCECRGGQEECPQCGGEGKV